MINNFDSYLLGKSQRLNTRNGNIRTVRNYLEWLENENIDHIDTIHTDIMEYVNYCKNKGNKNITINRKLLSLRHFYDYLISDKKLKINPITGIRIKGIIKRQPHDLLNEKELIELFEKYLDHNLVGKRNKSIIGMMVYQGLDSGEIAKLEKEDLRLEEGKIKIPSSNKSNGRTLELNGKQIIPLQIYKTEIRQLILAESKKESDRLFVSSGESQQLNNALGNLCKKLKKINPKVRNPTQIRMSVISLWLEKHDIRTVQYMAGHRYVSSTERYRKDKLEGLQEQLEKIHPLD
jgi:integrase/recombinase XerD